MKFKDFWKSLFSYTAKDLTYAVLYREKVQEVKVENIICEKDKESVYWLVIRDFDKSDPSSYCSRIKMDKSQYDKHIGERVNAIRVKESVLQMCLNPKGGHPCRVFSVYRKMFPWSEKPFEFSESDILSFGNSILKNPNYPFDNIDFLADDYRINNTYSTMRYINQFQELTKKEQG